MKVVSVRGRRKSKKRIKLMREETLYYRLLGTRVNDQWIRLAKTAREAQVVRLDCWTCWRQESDRGCGDSGEGWGKEWLRDETGVLEFRDDRQRLVIVN